MARALMIVGLFLVGAGTLLWIGLLGVAMYAGSTDIAPGVIWALAAVVLVGGLPVFAYGRSRLRRR